MLYRRPAQRADAVWLADHLRDADRQEVAAATGMTPAVVVPQNFDTSDRVTAVCDADTDEVVALYGVAPAGTVTGYGRLGYPWMLGTDKLVDHRYHFLRNIKAWQVDLAEGYALFANYVYAENQLHIDWLKWMGYYFGEAIPLGPFDAPFFPFYMRVNV